MNEATKPQPDPAAAYARQRLRLSLISGGLELALLIAFLWSGASLALSHGLSPNSWLRVLEYVALVGAGFKLIDLPWDWHGRQIEIRFGMNRQTTASWLADEAKATALGAILGIGGAELLYWLLRTAPQRWWLWAWIFISIFVVFMAQIGPVLLLPLFFKLLPLSDSNPVSLRLQSTYAAMRERDPKLPRLHGIFEFKLGEKSAKANAALTGWGRTRRVIISDTLLEASPVEEIEAVFLHELGHHVHRDIWRGLAFQSGLLFLGLWLAQVALRWLAPGLHLATINDVAGLPLILIVFTVLGLVLLPLSNGFVRAMERRADDYSFSALGTAQPLMAGLRRLAEKNLAEVEPARWKEWLLYSHPSIATRLRRGEAWEAANRQNQEPAS